MRNDAKISNRKVYLPNATHLGFSKYEAKRGDLIVYREHHADDSYQLRIARVIGTVDAPALEHSSAVKNHLFVLALSNSGDTVYERWVDPANVVECITSPVKFAAWFFSDAPMQYSPADVIRLSEYGTLCEHYIDKLPETCERLKIKPKK
jgi:hypothetical protein